MHIWLWFFHALLDIWVKILFLWEILTIFYIISLDYKSASSITTKKNNWENLEETFINLFLGTPCPATSMTVTSRRLTEQSWKKFVLRKNDHNFMLFTNCDSYWSKNFQKIKICNTYGLILLVNTNEGSTRVILTRVFLTTVHVPCTDMHFWLENLIVRLCTRTSGISYNRNTCFK